MPKLLRLAAAFKAHRMAQREQGREGSFLAGLFEDAGDAARAVFDRRHRLPRPLLYRAVFCLAYIISPIDLIPDFLFPMGLLDDAVVFGFLLKVLGDMAADYRARRGGDRKAPSVDEAVEAEAERVPAGG